MCDETVGPTDPENPTPPITTPENIDPGDTSGETDQDIFETP
ncbi:hypothetical protein [Spirosoma profusum]|nr:hypothetical protein [Spirosoma profusum]